MTGLTAAILLFSPTIGSAWRAPIQDPSDFEVAEPIRLAMTPRLDGELSPEEWDRLSSSGGVQSYLQWEPGWLFAAAEIPAGQDLKVSLDLNGDGWLVGRDNIEVRVRYADGAAQVQLRRLDATDRNGPVWTEAKVIPEIITTAARSTAQGWFFEMKMLDADLPKIESGRKLGVRMDSVAPDEVEATAFLPRRTALCSLQWDRGSGMIEGFKWGAEYRARSVVPGESIPIRLNMTVPAGSPFGRIQLRTEGDPKIGSANQDLPFPKIDSRQRAMVDYRLDVSTGATTGYRTLLATLVGEGGQTTTLRTSFLVSEPIRFDLTLPENLTSQPGNQVIKGSVRLRSQTTKRVDGVFQIIAPDGWTVIRGSEQKFGIFHPRGTARVGLELVSPPGVRGLIPLKLRATVGDKVIEETALLPIR